MIKAGWTVYMKSLSSFSDQTQLLRDGTDKKECWRKRTTSLELEQVYPLLCFSERKAFPYAAKKQGS